MITMSSPEASQLSHLGEGVGGLESLIIEMIEEPETVPEMLLPGGGHSATTAPGYDSRSSSGGMVATANAPVLYSWRELDNKLVTLRSNINDKIVNTHNVNYRVARATTRYPKSKWFVSGSKYNYSTPVNEVGCSGILWWRKCTVVRTVTVMAGVDFRTNTSDGRPFGVTTTYCQGFPGRCPDFVKSALNI